MASPGFFMPTLSANRTALWCWLGFALFIVYGTTVPFTFSADMALAAHHLARVTFNPLVSPDTGRRESIPDLTQNVLLFVPFGIFGAIALGPGRRSALLVTALAAALSVSVEAVQLFSIDRVTSFGDVVFDTIGGLLGALVGVRYQRPAAALLQRLVGSDPLAWPAIHSLGTAAFAVALAAWRPFDFTLDVSTVLAGVRSFQSDPWHLTGALTDSGASLVLYGWLTYSLADCVALRGFRTNDLGQAKLPQSVPLFAGTIGLCCAGALEASQVFIASGRSPGFAGFFARATGALLGALLWKVKPQPGRLKGISALAAVIGLAAALQLLGPFDIASSYRWPTMLPALSPEPGTLMNGLSRAVGYFVIYIPLGFWAARGLPLASARLRGVLLSFAIALPLEYALGAIRGGKPSWAEIGLAVGGGAIGVQLGLWRAWNDPHAVPTDTPRSIGLSLDHRVTSSGASRPKA